MKISLLLKKYRIEEKEFITADELKEHCAEHGFEYDDLVRYCTRRGYFVRIFKGIFHIRNPAHIKEGYYRYQHLELMANGLRLKKIKNWYFGLHTALKLNHMTHEYFNIDMVLNDTISRVKPMNVMGRGFKFVKTSKPLFHFGIIRERNIAYSDPEKTILDLIYFWRSNGVSFERISHDISEWAEGTKYSKLVEYSDHYPKSVYSIVRKIENRNY